MKKKKCEYTPNEGGCKNCQGAGQLCEFTKLGKGKAKAMAGVRSAAQAIVHQDTTNDTTLTLPKDDSSASASPQGDDTERELEEMSLYVGPGSGLRRGLMSSGQWVREVMVRRRVDRGRWARWQALQGPGREGSSILSSVSFYCVVFSYSLSFLTP